MLTYLFDLTICWTLLYGVFYLCMRRETFFKINRWYLLIALLLGLAIPLLRFIPLMETAGLYNRQVAEYIPIVYVIKDTPTIVAHTIAEQSFEWGQIFQIGIWTLYAAGCFFFLFRFAKGLSSIYTLYRQGEKTIHQQHTLIKTNGNHLPFSFLKMIFVSKTLPLNEDYNRILTHELEHVHARHSIDVLILEIINIVFWFHPMIYIYKSAIRQTHEYLADAAVCGSNSRQLYGQLLLRQSLSGLEIALAHHFFNSHIKKRINMIYQEKSGRKAWLKYALAVPALALLMLVFTSHQSPIKEPNKIEKIEIETNTNVLDNEYDLSEKQKEKLRLEVINVFTDESQSSTLEKEEKLKEIILKWNKKYPKKQNSIYGTISFTLFKDYLVITKMNGEVKIKALPLRIPDKEHLRTQESFNSGYPTLESITDAIKRKPYRTKLSLIQEYLICQSYYSNDANQNTRILNLFEKYIDQNNIQLGFQLKNIQLKYNVTAPKKVKDYINTTDNSLHPIFWGNAMGLYTPHHLSVDLSKPIGFYAYLSPSQAKSLYGPEGRNGIIALSNYALPVEHPNVQSEHLKQDISNFFSTIHQLPKDIWVDKLKTISKDFKSKYHNVRDYITPYTTIAHKHNITLVFKEGEIIKAYRGDGNSTDRIDKDQKVESKSRSTKTGNIESRKTLNDNVLSQSFIKSVYENFIVPQDLRAKGIEGAVVILLNINKDNRVTNYRVAHSLDDRFSKAANDAIKACEPIEVLDETKNVNLSKTYAINFIIEHDGIANSNSDSLLSIIHKDSSIEILDGFKIMYHFESTNNKKGTLEKKSKSTIDAKVNSPDQFDTITTYNPDTYEETIEIRSSADLAEFDKKYNSSNIFSDLRQESFTYDLNIKLTRSVSGDIDLYKKIGLKDKHLKKRSEYNYFVTMFDSKILSDLDLSKNGILTYKNPKQLKKETVIRAIIIPKKSMHASDTIITYNPETFEETIEINPVDSKPKYQKKRYNFIPTDKKTGLPSTRLIPSQPTNPKDTIRTIQFDAKREIVTRTVYTANDTAYFIQTFGEYFRSMPDYERMEGRITSEILSYRGKYKTRHKGDNYEKQIKMKTKTKNDQIEIKYESVFRDEVDFFLFDIRRKLIDKKSAKHSYPTTVITFDTDNLQDEVYFIGTMQGGRISSSKVKL